MKSIKKQAGKNKIKLTIELSNDEVMAYFDEELESLAPSVSVPGFRPGKAPRAMLIESIGHSRLSSYALEKAVNKAYQDAVFEHKHVPVSQPAISISKHPSFSDDGKNNELVFEVEYDIIPDVKIGDYRKIKLPKRKEEKIEVSSSEVDGVVKYLQRQKANLKDKSGEAKKGDWLEISFEGSIKNVKLDKLTSNNLPIVLGETKLIDGFEEKLIGIKKGEVRDFDLKVQKDFPDKEVAGKTAKFKVECLEIKEIVLPKIDKEFIEAFGLKSEKELRTRIEDSLFREKRERRFNEKKVQIAGELIKITKVDIPDSLIKGEADRMKASLEEDLKNRGLTLDQYQKDLKIDDKKMRSDLEAQAKKNIMLGLALSEVAKAEKIDIQKSENVDELYRRLIELIEG
ncbi:MAG: Trigger factor [candidate division WS2 bacterium ADurb.Bin280]|uniref:Trigger factor n=1 Tax=candidate division WS2 bacterium ADurb.Bin280 TaxID=1852829 RepID=A0A1V5SCF0_9BACT|nr:MAG: Trigger factor [candidate division WS2 bacterium ADurb.Bin280]